MKKCPYCAELVKQESLKCKHCGEILDSQLKKEKALEQKKAQPKVPKWSGGVAAILSFFIPGLGQMYKGNIVAGILWFFTVILGYFLLVIPGIILHIICVFTAASGNPYKE